MSETCEPNHDTFNNILTIGLIGGLFASYVPQHFRIIHKGSSEGFSPWFLLLGATSSAAGMLNMWTLQWGVVKCCKHLSAGSCLESLGAVIQVSLQWLLFAIIFVLYMLYYPPHLKYVVADVPTRYGTEQIKTNVMTNHWRTSIILAWVVVFHMAFITVGTFLLLISTKPVPSGPDQTYQISLWATFLGVTSAGLAAIQYFPQLLYTFRLKLVGALSIPMMLIQSPGAALMVWSIAMRPGTDWTSWIMFAVSGIMQAMLLVMCLCWKVRQKRLAIDDFGHPLPVPEGHAPVVRPASADRTVSAAVGDAMEEEVGPITNEELARAIIHEQSPLVMRRKSMDKAKKKGVFRWFSL